MDARQRHSNLQQSALTMSVIGRLMGKPQFPDPVPIERPPPERYLDRPRQIALEDYADKVTVHEIKIRQARAAGR